MTRGNQKRGPPAPAPALAPAAAPAPAAAGGGRRRAAVAGWALPTMSARSEVLSTTAMRKLASLVLDGRPMAPSSAMQRRNLKLKANVKSGSSHFSFTH